DYLAAYRPPEGSGVSIEDAARGPGGPGSVVSLAVIGASVMVAFYAAEDPRRHTVVTRLAAGDALFTPALTSTPKLCPHCAAWAGLTRPFAQSGQVRCRVWRASRFAACRWRRCSGGCGNCATTSPLTAPHTWRWLNCAMAPSSPAFES